MIGTCIFITDVVCCLLGLQWGGVAYPWSDWRIILLFVLTGVLTVVFIVSQKLAGTHATIPFYIIKQRNVAAACYFAFCLGGAFFVFIFWLPIWFQAIKGASAFKSGIMCVPLVLSLVAANIISGVGTTVVGYYVPFYYLATLFTAVGAGLFTTFQTTTAHPEWIGYQVVFGLGMGFGMQQALITVQTVLPLRDIPTATAMSMFFNTFGGALMVSVAQNVFNNQLVRNIGREVPQLASPALILHVGATSLKDAVPKALLPKVQVAYNQALTQTWYIAVAMACLSAFGVVFVQWRSVKGMKMGGAVGGA